MYTEFSTRHYLPLHFQPWWLDAVCGPGRWQAAVAPGGVLPWYRSRRWGLPVVHQPPFTAYGGPWLAEPAPDEKPANRLTRELHTLENLLRQLPRRVFFRQNLHPEAKNVLPFVRAGYRVSVRYTYRLPAGQLAAPWPDRLKSDVRRKIRRAAETTPVERRDDPDQLWALYQHSFRRKGLRPPPFRDAFDRLYAALSERGRGQMLVAGNAAVYVAFDDRTASLLFNGLVPTPDSPYVMYVLVYEALLLAAARGLAFDFEGSMDAGIERFYRQFGGELTPYFTIANG